MRIAVLLLTLLFIVSAKAQTFQKDFAAAGQPRVSINNARGRVSVVANPDQTDKILLTAESPDGAVAEKDLSFKAEKGAISIAINETAKRIDLTLQVPERTRLRIAGKDGEIRIAGNLESAEITSETGTIYADVPTDALKYHFLWTESRPRYLSDIEIPAPQEKAGGKFVLEGKFPADGSKPKAQISKANPEEPVESDEEIADEPNSANGDQPKKKKEKKEKKQKPADQRIALDFTTRRGVILLNVPPSEVPPDLRERDLTEAAKAVIRSGDSILIDAIRKVSPRRFGDYAKLLPPHRSEPNLVPSGTKRATLNANAETIRRVNVNVVDRAGRAVNGLTAADFTVFESGAERGILSVETTTAPFNLVLLLDVSGSVEERVDFIRKAARNFINTVSPQDKLAVIVFRDDIEVLSNFTTDRRKLSESLDTFDAGGATALYDSLAYTLVETLKPLRGERTAIVILSDGDDNRSFIPFDPLLGAIEESGALIYPLYIPSGLIPASRTIESNRTIDPIRTRYLSLTTKAEEEAKRLAEVSGGVYFPIRRLEDLQKAYDDVVAQLRTAYTVTYRSNLPEEITNERRLSPRLRVSVKREGAYVRIGAAASVPQLKSEIKESFEPLNRESITAAFQKIAFEPQFSQSATDITGEVKAIRYKPFATQNLRELSPENFDINRAPPSFVISDGNRKLAVSRWISPKRTRSYPYERVYNTLVFPKRAAVIPVLKDEGKDGERDFLQWDTFSLMNLLEVYVVLGYYDQATKSPRKADSLVAQQYNREFVAAKLKELSQSNLSAVEWNLRELKNLKQTIEKARAAYQKISEETGVRLHNPQGLETFERKLSGDILQFLEFSRQKSQKAQTREFLTDQPNETLTTRTKSRITISDYLGGKYFYTVDEAVFENGTLYLIESKHNQGGKLTGTGDIKEGLVKMIVYRNMVDVRRNGKPVKFIPVLRLTASQMQGSISSDAKPEDLAKFIELNRFDRKQAELLQNLFKEAKQNDFLIRLEQADTKK